MHSPNLTMTTLEKLISSSIQVLASLAPNNMDDYEWIVETGPYITLCASDYTIYIEKKSARSYLINIIGYKSFTYYSHLDNLSNLINGTV